MKALLVALALALAFAEAARSQVVAGTASANVRSSTPAAEFESARSGASARDFQPTDTKTEERGSAQQDGPSLFAESFGEDPGILEIKRIARELESERALVIQIAGLQRDLIEFAMADPVAAWRSRIPSSICVYALQKRFCDAMTSSFRKEGGNRQ